MTLTKAMIIDNIQNELKYSKKESTDVIEALLEIMKKSMENGEDVLISGFGKFCVKDKKKRRGRNPATGDDMMLDPRRVVTFKCSGKLRDKVNKKQP
ncbi:DNA-binding protein [Desulfonema limicola]|uniref:Integration host factor subunit alpha n=1 Tax=Desulfonema limicola TaxID=45656 RepID=A0A975BAH2_9BACT|nr:integration host factor subunit alpha [Desulfonema limicola]QTA81575.1 DNA-binding protein [Desulfonema limicola]